MSSEKANVAGCMTSKDNIRREIARQRRALDPALAERKSRRAQDRFVALPAFGKARRVAAYLAMAGEVYTDRILAAAWAAGKTACVPAYRTESGQYELAVIEENDAIMAGPWRTLEPARKQWIAIHDVDVIAIPGMAFDRHGHRLGRGGGHYDRMLASDAWQPAPGPTKVGLMFGFQLVEAVPAMKWDVNMDILVSEKESLRVNGEGE